MGLCRRRIILFWFPFWETRLDIFLNLSFYSMRIKYSDFFMMIIFNYASSNVRRFDYPILATSEKKHENCTFFNEKKKTNSNNESCLSFKQIPYIRTSYYVRSCRILKGKFLYFFGQPVFVYQRNYRLFIKFWIFRQSDIPPVFSHIFILKYLQIIIQKLGFRFCFQIWYQFIDGGETLIYSRRIEFTISW